MYLSTPRLYVRSDLGHLGTFYRLGGPAPPPSEPVMVFAAVGAHDDVRED